MVQIDYNIKTGVNHVGEKPHYSEFNTSELFNGSRAEGIHHAYSVFRQYIDNLASSPICTFKQIDTLHYAQTMGVMVGTVSHQIDSDNYVLFQFSAIVRH